MGLGQCDWQLWFVCCLCGGFVVVQFLGGFVGVGVDWFGDWCYYYLFGGVFVFGSCQ